MSRFVVSSAAGAVRKTATWELDGLMDIHGNRPSNKGFNSVMA
jgi:hypothetical protein